MGKMDIICTDCQALHWLSGKLVMSSQINPKFGMCCYQGKIKVSTLKDLPPVTCHFILFLLPLFDLCLISRYFHYFHFLSSIFQSPTLSYDLLNPLSSIFCSLFILQFLIYLLPYSIFCLMFLCSVFIIIFPPSVHYSLPSLSNLDNSTFHSL